MESNKLLSYISLKDYPFLLFAKVYINGFNVFISIMLQLGVALALNHQAARLIKILMILIVASLGYAFIYYAYSMYSERLRKRVVEDVSQRLLASSLQNIDPQTDNGTMVNLINQDADNVANYFMLGIMPAVDFIMIIIGGLAYTFYNSWIYGLVYLLIGCGLYLVAHHFYLKDVKYRQVYQLDDDHQKNFLPDVYHNLAIIRIFHVSNWLVSENNRLFANKSSSLRKEVGATSSSSVVVRGGIYVMEIISLFVGLLLVNQHQISFNVMLGVWNAGIGSIFDPFLTLPVILAFIARQKVSVGRINAHAKVAQPNSKLTGNFNTKIKLVEAKHLTYKYPDNNQPTLHNLSFQIRPNRITFVVGKNGAGKTTLLHILLGILTVKAGSLIVHTTSEASYPSLAHYAAYVPQAGQLFETTIADNLRLGKSVTDEELQQALKEVQMFTAVSDLPKGINSVVGKDTDFSSGQVRRLAVARALLAHREFLILDEPFSDIDDANQQALVQLCHKLARDHGIIIVSHTFNLITDEDDLIKVGDLNE